MHRLPCAGGRLALFGVVALLLVAVGVAAVPRLAVVGAALQDASPAASPPAAEGVEFSGWIQQPGLLTVADLQQMPAETVDVEYQSGEGTEQHSFTGTRLYGVLEQLQLQADPDARNPWLRVYVVVTAKDGYQVVLSGGELDPNFGNAPILLAWEQDGAPLTGDDAPARLVVPGDTRGGRYVFGVIRIEVFSLDTETAS
jgi:DMSO/TMAO reductase YedYZ molybdopterin-dependent catalytic subunit